MIRTAFCRFCSTEKEDERDLHFIDDYVICSNCKKILIQVPVGGGPYYWFVSEEDIYA